MTPSGRYSFLLLEDNPLDAALEEQRLIDAGIAVDLVVVDTRNAFVSAFETQPFDLIMADYSLPDFDGLAALDIVRAKYGRLPFIFVSGVLGEDVAVDTMLRGATDYVLKTRLDRLVPAVLRALKEHEEYLLREEAETKLREAQAAAASASERQGLLLALLQQQRTSTNDEVLMIAAARQLVEHFNASRSGFFEILPDGALRYLWQWSADGATEQELLPLDSFDVSRAEGYRRGERAVVSDVWSSGGSTAAALAAAGIRSFVASPILRGGQWCAGFYVAHSAPRAWSEAEVVFICEVAEITWDSIERARALVALEASEQRLRTAAETADLGSWDLDLATGRMICSEQCKKNYGWPLDRDFNYSDLRAAIHPDDKAAMAAGVENAIAGRRTYRAEYRNIWPDGSVHWVIAAGRAQYDEGGKAIRMAGFTLDVTDRHKSQEALMQSEKLAAVGRLASSIAHEINNPLESVTNLLYIAAASDNIVAIKGYLNLADQELRRVAAITNQTLRFHRQSGAAREVTSGELVDGVLSVFHRRLQNSDIRVNVRLRSTRSVRCLDGEIRQVLNNLVSNSIDAMRPGGCIALRSRDASRNGIQGIWITIADNGVGIAKNIKGKLFEAFFSTKGINGTGLGLWVSQEIVKRHHGVLRFRSNASVEKHGTAFALFLPIEGPLESRS